MDKIDYVTKDGNSVTSKDIMNKICDLIQKRREFQTSINEIDEKLDELFMDYRQARQFEKCK